MATHEWRVRECNVAADLVCNVMLQAEEDVNTANIPTVAASIRNGAQLQLFSDGGFNAGIGASGFVVVLHHWDEARERWCATLAGCRGIRLRQAHSAFQAEVVAAEMAINFAVELGDFLCNRQ